MEMARKSLKYYQMAENIIKKNNKDIQLDVLKKEQERLDIIDEEIRNQFKKTRDKKNIEFVAN